VGDGLVRRWRRYGSLHGRDVFVVRTVGIVMAMAVTVLGQAEFAVFTTVYFLAQAPVLVAAVLEFRSMRFGAGNKLAGANDP
jgi:hypothetical protein